MSAEAESQGGAMDETNIGGREGFGSDRLRAEVLHQLPNVVCLWSGPDHTAEAINQTTVEFYGGLNTVGMRLADTLAGADGQGITELYDRAFAGETVNLDRARFTVITTEGFEDEVIVDFTIVPFRDADDRIVGSLVSAIDVTKQVRREEAVEAEAESLRQRYRRATDVIDEVQRALLPARLPVLPRLDVAASYVVGGAEQAAGGDWFDVIARPDGTVGLVVGDVVGHGVQASAVMAQLRAVTLERVRSEATATEVVEALDRFVDAVPEGRSATVCVALLDPMSGALTYCSAGHPPPLVIDGDHDARFLALSGEPAVGCAIERGSLSADLSDDAVVLLYTDGIVERPGVDASAGMVELRRTAESAYADRLYQGFSLPAAVDRVATQTLERLTRETGSRDDITLLAVRRTAAPDVLELELDLGRADIGAQRDAVVGWFRPGQVDPAASDRLGLVVTELCENVAYLGASGGVTISVTLDSTGMLELTVTDEGTWRPPPQPNDGRGLGLALVQDIAAHVDVDGTPTGTTVRVRFAPWKASHSTAPRPPVPDSTVFDVVHHERNGRSVLSLGGPVDTASLDELDGQLRLSTKPGSPDLVVGLDDVTLLTSAAIHALGAAVDRAATGGVDVSLVCRPGTVAQQVLAIAGLPTVLPKAVSG